jgi:hypothetical protein
MMNRKERRVAAHKALKLARKARFAVAATPVSQPDTAINPSLMSNHGGADALVRSRPSGRPGPTAEPSLSAFPAFTIPEPGLPFPTLSSISPAQLTANRANAELSTGPKTEAGRAISSQNRTTHGLARHNGAFVLLSSEDPIGFESLKASLAEEHQPSTETESILINTMAESHWLANRAQTLQNTCFDPQSGQITDAQTFSLYLRYQTTHTRAFHKCLNTLVKLRAETRKQQNGFEAQSRKEEEIRIKNERHQMKKQTHYWEVLKKDAETCFPGFDAKYNAELAKHAA